MLILEISTTNPAKKENDNYPDTAAAVVIGGNVTFYCTLQTDSDTEIRVSDIWLTVNDMIIQNSTVSETKAIFKLHNVSRSLNSSTVGCHVGNETSDTLSLLVGCKCIQSKLY